MSVPEDHDAPVISNDRYDEHREQNPWIDERRVPFMIVRGEVEIHGLDEDTS